MAAAKADEPNGQPEGQHDVLPAEELFASPESPTVRSDEPVEEGTDIAVTDYEPEPTPSSFAYEIPFLVSPTPPSSPQGQSNLVKQARGRDLRIQSLPNNGFPTWELQGLENDASLDIRSCIYRDAFEV